MVVCVKGGFMRLEVISLVDKSGVMLLHVVVFD